MSKSGDREDVAELIEEEEEGEMPICAPVSPEIDRSPIYPRYLELDTPDHIEK